MSLYMSAVVSAGYQLMPEDATDFSARVAKVKIVRRREPSGSHVLHYVGSYLLRQLVGSSLNVEADAELAPELEVADEPEDAEEMEEGSEGEGEEETTEKDEV